MGKLLEDQFAAVRNALEDMLQIGQPARGGLHVPNGNCTPTIASSFYQGSKISNHQKDKQKFGDAPTSRIPFRHILLLRILTIPRPANEH